MKLFSCSFCSALVYFENTRCLACGHGLAYDPVGNEMQAYAMGAGGPVAVDGSSASMALCDNAGAGVCNWRCPPGASGGLCLACRHNAIIPDLSAPAAHAQWGAIEAAKHRLFYGLLRLGLPHPTRAEHAEGLEFHFLAAVPQGERVVTGHSSGTITLALDEADDAERERRRAALGEPYRTLLGHFRHEIAHYYWDRLVRDSGRNWEFAAIFGDTNGDYAGALANYYRYGAPPDWPDRFVSAYATAHPFEDFAETFAHYLHIVDTLEMARALRLSASPRATLDPAFDARGDLNPYAEVDFGPIIDAWLPLTHALNALTRCIGHADAYPFVLAPAAVEKLAAIHRLVHQTGRADSNMPSYPNAV